MLSRRSFIMVTSLVPRKRGGVWEQKPGEREQLGARQMAYQRRRPLTLGLGIRPSHQPARDQPLAIPESRGRPSILAGYPARNLDRAPIQTFPSDVQSTIGQHSHRGLPGRQMSAPRSNNPRLCWRAAPEGTSRSANSCSLRTER